MVVRNIQQKIIGALDNFRIIYIDGARQTGKSTFVKELAANLNYTYVTFDDDDAFDLATTNSKRFFETYLPPIVIDEVQKVPKILNIVKLFVDNSQAKGQFILTGSVDLLKSMNISESLAGRMAGFKLFPFSYSELKSTNFNLIDVLFQENFYTYFANIENKTDKIICEKLTHGNFPEIHTIVPKYRKQWFGNYLKARISKDISSLTESNLRKLDKMPDLFTVLAAQTSNLLNINNIAQKLALSPQTVDNYVYLLEGLFLIEKLKPYAKNISAQVKKMNKMYFVDTGIVSHLIKATPEKLLFDRALYGQLLENYVFNEIQKQISFSDFEYDVSFYRDNKTNEVDFVIENEEGKYICIEVKSAQNITDDDLKGLKIFYNLNKENILAMYLFYGGATISARKIADASVVLLPHHFLF